MARHLGLPNWNHAASPCLRSRLALGVLATDEALRRVEQAEELVREALPWVDVHHNLRVRTLAKKRAVVEIDHSLLDGAQATLGAFPYSNHGRTPETVNTSATSSPKFLIPFIHTCSPLAQHF